MMIGFHCFYTMFYVILHIYIKATAPLTLAAHRATGDPLLESFEELGRKVSCVICCIYTLNIDNFLEEGIRFEE